MPTERLTRDVRNSMIAGVCAGIARRYHVDVTLVRVAWVVLGVITAGLAIPLYIAAWIVMPREDAVTPSATTPPETPPRISDEMRQAGDRLAEAARVIAGKTREAAEEIAEIARRPANASQPHASNEPPHAPEFDPDAPPSPVREQPWQPPTAQPPVPPMPPPPPPPPQQTGQ